MENKFDYADCELSPYGMKNSCCKKTEVPDGRIPTSRIIEKVDSLFWKNDYTEAGRVLVYWRDEAVLLHDERGELSMESELVGYYRKQNDKENGLKSVLRALELTELLGQGETASGATVFVNCATAYRAFEKPSEAIPLYRRAEKIYKKLLKDGDGRFGALYNNMALALADVGDREGAEQAYFSALSVMEKIDGGEAECAITYINLAHMYEDFQKPELIRGCMEKAYTLLQSDKLVHDGNYAFVIEKCAPSFGYFGDVETYEKLKKEAEEIYARA